MAQGHPSLYKLVMRSDKPEAKSFQDWVTKVVLSAIRKDGAYIKDEENVSAARLRVVNACGKRRKPDFINLLIRLRNRAYQHSGGEGGIRTRGGL